ncbi:MAG TPA: hypothetical protein VKK19_17630, partial [Candidatus Dormibacteraeota bacterium]|nr:hypothetical protein [Candidatus Dormibacteraeota bacterium]
RLCWRSIGGAGADLTASRGRHLPLSFHARQARWRPQMRMRVGLAGVRRARVPHLSRGSYRGAARPSTPAVAPGFHRSCRVRVWFRSYRSNGVAGLAGADPSADVAVSVLDDTGATRRCLADVTVHHNHLLPPLEAGGTKLSHGSRDRKDDDPDRVRVKTRSIRAPPIPLGIER